MGLLVLVVCAGMAALVSWVMTPATIRLAKTVGAIDEPGVRKVHSTPVPRLGGLAVILACVAGFSLFALIAAQRIKTTEAGFWTGVALGVLPILAVSFVDDVRSVRAFPKFAAQLLGAGIAVVAGIRLGPEIHLFDIDLQLGWIALPLSIVWLVGVTNAFNIVDGLDGLSAGLALISAISLGAVSVVANRPEMTAVSFIIAGALFGFLPYNIHPARVFLGDTGATAVGFTLACLALRGGSTLSAGLAILIPVLVLGLPIADTLVSMVRRLLKRLERKAGGVFEADGEHFHHRLLSLGLGHRQAVFVLYGAGLLFAVCGVGSMFLTYRRAAVLLVSLLIAAFVGLKKLGYDEFAIFRRGTMLRAYEVPVLRSTLFVGFIDVTFVVLALYAALVLKYDDWLIRHHRSIAHSLLPIVVASFVVSLSLFRVYRGSWRMANAEDLVRPFAATVTASVASFVVAAMLFEPGPSVSLQVIFMILAIGLIVGARASYRLLVQINRRAAAEAEGERVLIYGAGRAGTMVLREALDLALHPVGFVDDDPYLEGRFVNGLPVVGSGEALDELLSVHAVAGVIISSDKLAAENVEAVREACRAAGCWMRRFEISLAEEGAEMAGVTDVPLVPIRTAGLPRSVEPNRVASAPAIAVVQK